MKKINVYDESGIITKEQQRFINKLIKELKKDPSIKVRILTQ